VVHCAAWPGRGVIPPREVLASNVEATLNLCQAALPAGVEKFVYASSVQVFGSRVMLGAEGPEVEYLPLDDAVSPNPRNLYGFSKVVGEVLVRSILSTARRRLSAGEGIPMGPKASRITSSLPRRIACAFVTDRRFSRRA